MTLCRSITLFQFGSYRCVRGSFRNTDLRCTSSSNLLLSAFNGHPYILWLGRLVDVQRKGPHPMDITLGI